ncbi:transposase (plasmid) [Streptomyces sp. NBC_00984]|nr:transposase [Streptomyces sp. NBC_00984]
MTARSDALFELCDALLCSGGPARTLVDLALAPEHRRGHGALYGCLNQGRIDVARLRRALAGLPLPRATGGRLVLAADVSPRLRRTPIRVAAGPFVTPLAARRGQAPDGARLAVLDRCRPGDWPHVMYGHAGRGPAGARRRRCRSDHRPDPRSRRAPNHRGPAEAGRPARSSRARRWRRCPRIAHFRAGLSVEILGWLRSDRHRPGPMPRRVVDRPNTGAISSSVHPPPGAPSRL